ncbi:nuclease-related domain-containing protein [Macrococcus sp. EM39E]|uniref:nuclease-related domain-containing protein n=1 Tax=Macrococcus animalis TaxID=3395467 RepID=UPI0039BEB224
MFLKTYDFSLYEAYIWEVAGRIELDQFDQSQAFSFNLGYTGEKMFYDEIKNTTGGVKLWNIRLRSNGEVQFDFLLIKDEYIINIDVKNFSGKYTFSNNNFVSENNYVEADPLSKLYKAEQKLKYFCTRNNINYKVKSYILFINPMFELSGFSSHENVLYRDSIPRIVNMLNKDEPLYEEIEIGKLLMKHHYPNSRYQRIHYYPYPELKPGVKCPECRELLPFSRGRQRKVSCICGFEISKSKLVDMAFHTIKILKNNVVTTTDIFNYTGIGRTTIRNVLTTNFEKCGENKGSKYTIKKSEMGIFEKTIRYEIHVGVDKSDKSTPMKQ